MQGADDQCCEKIVGMIRGDQLGQKVTVEESRCGDVSDLACVSDWVYKPSDHFQWELAK